MSIIQSVVFGGGRYPSELKEDIEIIENKLTSSGINDYEGVYTAKRTGFTPYSAADVRYMDEVFNSINFYPFYSTIKTATIELYSISSVNNYVSITVGIFTDRGIEYSTRPYFTGLSAEESKYTYKTKYGLLQIEIDYAKMFASPIKKFKAYADVYGSIDTSDTYLKDLDFYDVGQNEWIPTVGSGLIGDLAPYGISIVDNKQGYIEEKYTEGYFSIYWDKLQPTNSTSIDTAHISSLLSQVITEGFRKGMHILPSTLPSSTGGNSIVVGEDTIYYKYPVWLHNQIIAQNDGDPGVYKPSVMDVNDYVTDEAIKVYILDYRDTISRTYFENAISLLYDYFSNDPSGISQYPYIEYIKAGIFGLWGEGISWNNIPDSNTLINITDTVINTFIDRICILPFASLLNVDFPEDYRNYLTSGNNGSFDFGMYLDSGGRYGDRYRYNPQFSGDPYSYAYKVHRKVPFYIECFQHIESVTYFPTEPIFRTLATQIMYYRPNWMSYSNLFFQTSAQLDTNLILMLKKISRYVGVKLYSIHNRTKYDTLTNELKIWFTLGNMGTSKIYFDYWKIRITITDGIYNESFILDFDLKTIDAAFEVGVINWRDTKAVVQDLTLTNTYDENVEVMAEIIDIDSISPNMYINKQQVLPLALY